MKPKTHRSNTSPESRPEHPKAVPWSRPSHRSSVRLRKIVVTDYWSFILLLLNLAATITVVGIPALLGLLPLLIRRLRGIQRILNTGQATTGVVLRKKFLRGEWVLNYGFKSGSTVVQARNFVLGFKIPLKKGDEVEVLYDSENPSRAYLPILYTSS